MTHKIILDCDPGIDDALAIVFAVGSSDLAIVGITTVAGNAGVDITTANALRICEFLGRADLPVAPGCVAPLLRAPRTARMVHGSDGLGGSRLPKPTTNPCAMHATDFIIESVAAAPGEITLVATGPLSNVALAVRREPRLASQVRNLVIMGGSYTRGNVTPAAEFNIAADPEAAAIVFSAGWTVTMVGLDVTHQVRAGRAVINRMRALGRLTDELVLPCLGGHGNPHPEVGVITGGANAEQTGDGPAVHDLCAVAQVARPSLFGYLPAKVQIETVGQWTAGMTVTDFRAPRTDCNARVATTIDIPDFWDLVLDAYGRAAASLQG